MTVQDSGTVISLSTNNERYSGALLAIVIREHGGDIEAHGDPRIIFTNLLHMFEIWQQKDPEGYETIQGIFTMVFDIAGRDLDKELKDHE